ncbi:hypothetical protein PROFUN_06451 [Planoprotostelium fungivorum]|uniref:Chorismate synthase n=1 Tax=Planoprotostelium fungivorum TaxID=1890364 RepID=A0A2P6MR32_9EUKA|nr:hypothetical protein PROFUN_06451 [Planoprotostelium fungivorum]
MSSFGTLFRISTFGESHGKGVGVIVDGCPPCLKLSEADIQVQLDRRRPGQSHLTTAVSIVVHLTTVIHNSQRSEADRVTIQSGTENGVTLGTPISCFVPNQDQRPGDYKEMNAVPRPSHADYTYQEKYLVAARSGGGRASARETIGRVAAGAIAEKWLKEQYNTEIVAFVSAIGEVSTKGVDINTITRDEVDKSLVRCPDKEAVVEMQKVIESAKADEDSIGGVITCVIRNVPTGLGEPCFDKLEAKLAHAMLSIPATKGFEVGSGFEGAKMRGSAHNDMFFRRTDGKLGTHTNFSGGIQGGISNGEHIFFRVAFKPAATIGRDQETVDFSGKPATLAAKGRHDPCVTPRAIPIVETMAALVLADAALIQMARKTAGLYLQQKE